MERNIPETIVIELNGCCGCGKSTLVAMFGKQLKENRIRYITLSELLNQNQMKWYQNLLGCNRGIGSLLLRYCCSIRPIRFDRIDYFKHVLNLYNAINQVIQEGRYDVILLDEGILQGLSSIAYLDNIQKKEATIQALDALFKNKKFCVVNCNLEYEELLRRIDKRKRNVGRIDKHVGAETMKRVLKSQYGNLKKLRKVLPEYVVDIDLDMKQENEKNAEMMLAVCQKLLEGYQ